MLIDENIVIRVIICFLYMMCFIYLIAIKSISWILVNMLRLVVPLAPGVDVAVVGRPCVRPGLPVAGKVLAPMRCSCCSYSLFVGLSLFCVFWCLLVVALLAYRWNATDQKWLPMAYHDKGKTVWRDTMWYEVAQYAIARHHIPWY